MLNCWRCSAHNIRRFAHGIFLLVCFGEMPHLQVEMSFTSSAKALAFGAHVSASMHKAFSDGASTFAQQLTAKTPPSIICTHFNPNVHRHKVSLSCVAHPFLEIYLCFSKHFVLKQFCVYRIMWMSKSGIPSTVTPNALHATLIHVSWRNDAFALRAIKRVKMWFRVVFV